MRITFLRKKAFHEALALTLKPPWSAFILFDAELSLLTWEAVPLRRKKNVDRKISTRQWRAKCGKCLKKKNHKTLELEATLQIVTESKLIRLATLQANKPRDKLLGQGIVTLFGKPADREDSELVSQRTSLPKSEFSFLLYWEEGITWNISWCRPASEGGVLISFSLQSFTAGPGVLCELNKGILG